MGAIYNDTFGSADSTVLSTHDAGWVGDSADFQIFSGAPQVVADGWGLHFAYRNETYDQDQYVESNWQLNANDGSITGGPCLCLANSGGIDGYWWQVTNAGVNDLYRVDDGNPTLLASGTASAVSNGDLLRMEITADGVQCYINGVTTNAPSSSDVTYRGNGGAPGFGQQQDGSSSCPTNFEGGDVAASGTVNVSASQINLTSESALVNTKIYTNNSQIDFTSETALIGEVVSVKANTIDFVSGKATIYGTTNAVNMKPVTVAIRNWTPGGDGKIRGFDKTGSGGGGVGNPGTLYGTQGWNKGEYIGNGIQYYVSPTGDQGNDGLSPANPWPLTYALTQVVAGDTINLADGTYVDPIKLDGSHASGTQGEPITVRGNFGAVFITPPSGQPGIDVYSNISVGQISGWTIDGVIAKCSGEVPAILIYSWDGSTVEQMTHNFVVKRCGGFGGANLTNTTAVDMTHCTNVLFEDVFCYGFGRKGFSAYAVLYCTCRRVIGRYDYWAGLDDDKPNEPRMDFAGYNALNCIFENCLAFDSANDPPNRASQVRAGMGATGNQSGSTSIDGSEDNLYLGCIVFNCVGVGLYNNGGSGSPTRGIIFRDCVFWDNSQGGFDVQNNALGTIVEYVTCAENGSTGFRLDPNPQDPIGGIELRNSAILNNLDWSIVFPDSPQFAVLSDTSAAGSPNDSSDIEAANMPTFDYILMPTMVAGKPRGATVIYKTVDGVLTNEPLWPFPYEDVIQANMLNDADLIATNRTVGGVGVPGWKTSGKTLTNYIWEYLGNAAPNGYGA